MVAKGISGKDVEPGDALLVPQRIRRDINWTEGGWHHRLGVVWSVGGPESRARVVADIPGEEKLERITEHIGAVGHLFIWEAQGLPKRFDHPHIRLERSTGEAKDAPICSTLGSVKRIEPNRRCSPPRA